MDNASYIEGICVRAREASRLAAVLSTREKNAILTALAKGVREGAGRIIDENRKDLDAAKENHISKAMYDRLLLNPERIEGIAKSIEEIRDLEDPVGRIEKMHTRPSGIRVGQMRVPIGVIAVIYESRPNVTTDIAALAIKSGNAAILRGGKESIHTNLALYSIIKETLRAMGHAQDIITLIEKTDRELVMLLLHMNRYIDIVVPRGGDALIEMVTRESRIPVIKHDKGVCHTFIDNSADTGMAIEICINAKVQRPGVCNAMETLLIHRDFTDKAAVLGALKDKGVELRGCPRTVAVMPDAVRPADEEDWYAEYGDLILAVKVVDSMEEAMAHIVKYGSSHSEAIITENYTNAERFLREVDSAAVFVNSSTRFHDGGEFGLGAEVGISTQKLHARGTMGIEGLTCLKYVVYGTGQVRS